MRHSRRRVLIVEDNYDSVITLITLIQGMGHDAQYALTGEAALDAARKFRPDIVLLDIGLPGIDGYQVARLLRQDFGHALQIIAITGYGTEADRQKCLDAGIDQHILKPAQVDFLDSLLG